MLRNQLIEGKTGSVVIFDEATWLNSPEMISPAKRTFNGDRTQLQTSYFGTTIEGTGVSLEAPPMLIFVASNDPITDPALKSRFDTISYPKPSTETLISYAFEIASNSVLLREQGIVIEQSRIKEWVSKNGEHNFRSIAANIEAYLMSSDHSE